MGRKVAWVICDYAPDDLALDEVVNSVEEHLDDDWHVHPASVPNFDTISLAFMLAQLALKEVPAGHERIFLANSAPRKDLAERRVENDGEELYLAVLKNGTRALVVNSGYSLSLIKGYIQQLHKLSIPRKGSQFRSRDFFPMALGKIASGAEDIIGEQLDPNDAIPDPPHPAVLYVDNFGNIKTSLREGDPFLKELKEGALLTVKIGHHQLTATFTQGNFNVPEGYAAFGKGSSGWDRRFFELFVRGGSAWDMLQQPEVGSLVAINALKHDLNP